MNANKQKKYKIINNDQTQKTNSISHTHFTNHNNISATFTILHKKNVMPIKIHTKYKLTTEKVLNYM